MQTKSIAAHRNLALYFTRKQHFSTTRKIY